VTHQGSVKTERMMVEDASMVENAFKYKNPAIWRGFYI
jgi:hypothetical protein